LGEDAYPTVQEKAANLLYFIVKDHPFTDGCKRITNPADKQILQIVIYGALIFAPQTKSIRFTP